MEKYRIVSNGLEYAVEIYREVGFFKKRMEWERDRTYLGESAYVENRYDTLEKARRRVIELKDEWKEVK